MPAAQTYVIVGASLAGAKAAETLRDEGFDGAIVLIGAETDRPYERPPLSKDVLLGTQDRRTRPSCTTPAGTPSTTWTCGWAPGSPSLDRGARQVRLEDGSAVGYTRLLLTTGASARRLPVPGADLDGLMYLRTMPESAALAARLQQGGHVVIAGAGWIGLEAAAAARQAGCEVTIVEPEAAPLLRSIGPELGEVFGRLHRAPRRHLPARRGRRRAARRPAGGSAAPGQAHGTVRQVVTSAGTVLDADFVLAGIGAVPNVSLAAEAGLDVEGGILVDASLRTSDPDIFAAGDVGQRVQPAAGPPHHRPALVQRAERRPGRGPRHARPGRLLRPGALLLHRPVRPRHGDAGLPEPGTYDQVAYRGDPEPGSSSRSG